VHALAHITGGGLLENIPRVLADNQTAELIRSSWPESQLFKWIQEQGQVPFDEMNRVFNCGIGMIVILDQANAQAALEALESMGEKAYQLGRIRDRAEGEPQTIVLNQ
jgi:phosphoribosylformylglycinamidine cyclo-ligase